MLDQQTLTAYQQDGAAVLRNVISLAWIERLREGVEQNLREPGPHAKHYTPAGNPGMFFGDYCNWERIEPYRDFFFHSNASALAAELMGSPKVNLYHEHVLVKEPGTKVFFKIFDSIACSWQRQMGFFSATSQATCIPNVDDKLEVGQIEMISHEYKLFLC